MEYDQLYQQTISNRRSSFLIMKNDKIISSLDEEADLLRNSMQQVSIDGHRLRSFSAGSLPMAQKLKSKIPNFKKAHEMQFERMESITDYAKRKAERAKALLTPPRLMRKTSPVHQIEVPPQSKLPVLKRSLSVNYKNSESNPSKKFKADNEKRFSFQPNTIDTEKATLEQKNNLSRAASWLKSVKLNRRFQLLMMNQHKKI
ncbi:hypothetical protein ACKWTF_011576 [Chironomus riparius]